MRLLIYKFLAEKQVAVTLSDIENAFRKSSLTYTRYLSILKEGELYIVQVKWIVKRRN